MKNGNLSERRERVRIDSRNIQKVKFTGFSNFMDLAKHQEVLKMAPKFLFPKGFNFNLPLSIISLLNQPLKYINISTLSISFHPFSVYNFLSYGPQLNPLPHLHFTPHLLQWFLSPPFH